MLSPRIAYLTCEKMPKTRTEKRKDKSVRETAQNSHGRREKDKSVQENGQNPHGERRIIAPCEKVSVFHTDRKIDNPHEKMAKPAQVGARRLQSGLTYARVATEIRVGRGNACLSTARQAFKVAPVVNVSSTRRMWAAEYGAFIS